MMYNLSKGEMEYMSVNQGHFSKALAEWAIGRMRRKEGDKLVKINAVSISDTQKLLNDNNINLDDAYLYDAWYLHNMCLADYRRTLPENEDIAMYIDETINDPDGAPEMVLACFRAKMDVMGVPIFWERYL